MSSIWIPEGRLDPIHLRLNVQWLWVELAGLHFPVHSYVVFAYGF